MYNYFIIKTVLTLSKSRVELTKCLDVDVEGSYTVLVQFPQPNELIAKYSEFVS
jgi:hypothetical protein